MSILLTAVSLLLSYLLGSIPTSVWAGRYFHGIDIREHGSGNAGATNVFRVLGWKTAIPVMLIDVAKGWAAAMLPVFFHLVPEKSILLTDLQIVCGITAVVGHIFPVFAGFRGGKGVAAMFGAVLAIHPLLTLCCMGVFLIVLLITGIVSVSSMSSGVAFPILLFTVFQTPSIFFRIFSIVIAIALFFTHRKNIQRLLKGEEKKLFGKK